MRLFTFPEAVTDCDIQNICVCIVIDGAIDAVLITSIIISFVFFRNERRMHRLGRSFDGQFDADFRIESVVGMAFRPAHVVRLVVIVDERDYDGPARSPFYRVGRVHREAVFFCFFHENLIDIIPKSSAVFLPDVELRRASHASFKNLVSITGFNPKNSTLTIISMHISTRSFDSAF